MPGTFHWSLDIFVRYVIQPSKILHPNSYVSNICLHEMVMWLIIWPTRKTVSLCWNGIRIAVCIAVWFTTAASYKESRSRKFGPYFLYTMQSTAIIYAKSTMFQPPRNYLYTDHWNTSIKRCKFVMHDEHRLFNTSLHEQWLRWRNFLIKNCHYWQALITVKLYQFAN